MSRQNPHHAQDWCMSGTRLQTLLLINCYELLQLQEGSGITDTAKKARNGDVGWAVSHMNQLQTNPSERALLFQPCFDPNSFSGRTFAIHIQRPWARCAFGQKTLKKKSRARRQNHGRPAPAPAGSPLPLTAAAASASPQHRGRRGKFARWAERAPLPQNQKRERSRRPGKPARPPPTKSLPSAG